MFTIFDCFPLFGGFTCLVAGATLGGHQFGVIGAVGGALVGLCVGVIAGRIPWIVSGAFMRRDLKRATSQNLRERVVKEYYISHLLIAELALRGESIETLREIVQRQLSSESADVRRFGEANAKLWFPELMKAG